MNPPAESRLGEEEEDEKKEEEEEEKRGSRGFSSVYQQNFTAKWL